jgi:hypothetical protein
MEATERNDQQGHKPYDTSRTKVGVPRLSNSAPERYCAGAMKKKRMTASRETRLRRDKKDTQILREDQSLHIQTNPRGRWRGWRLSDNQEHSVKTYFRDPPT